MDRTLDELTERLRPGNLLDSVVGYFSGNATPSASAGSGRSDEAVREAALSAGSALATRMRNHPLPTALIGAGLAWLALGPDRTPQRAAHYARDRYRRSRIDADEPETHGGSYVDARTGEPYDHDTYGKGHVRTEDDGDRAFFGRVGDYVSDKAHAAGDAAKDAFSSARQSATDAGSRFAGSASDSARRAHESARRQGRSALREARQRAGSGYAYSRDRFDGALKEHPLAVGVAALAAGVLAGLAVPRTRVEDESFGVRSRQAKDAAADAAGEAYDRGRQVVERGIDTATDVAEREGLHPEQLKERAGRVADAVTEVAQDAARDASGRLQDAGHEAEAEAERHDLTPAGLADSAKAVVEETKDAVVDEADRQTQDVR
jgi:hypothetical protein